MPTLPPAAAADTTTQAMSKTDEHSPNRSPFFLMQTYQKSFLIVGFLSLSPFGRHKKIPLIPFVKKYEGKSDFMSDYSASASLFFLLFLRLALLFALASSIFAAFSAS